MGSYQAYIARSPDGSATTKPKTKKDLKFAIDHGFEVALRPTSMFDDPSSFCVGDREGTFYVTGPDPLGGAPNKWYAVIKVKFGETSEGDSIVRVKFE